MQSEEGGQPEDFFSYSGMRSFFLESEEELEKVFRNVEIPAKKARVGSVITLVNSCFKFKNITIQDGKFTKFLPHKDCEILIVESNYPIYLLQSDEENVSFFVIEVGEAFAMDSIQAIFNVRSILPRAWASNPPSSTTSGCPFSTSPTTTWMRWGSPAPKLFQPTTVTLWAR
jgi:hypothetical protein